LIAVLTAVARSGYWRVKLEWPHPPPRFFGRFLTRAEAERWIADHQWLTKLNLKRLPDQAKTDPAKHND
jgi:hypothetical protein